MSQPTDKSFEQFTTMEMGIRAGFCIIRTYLTKYKITTVAGVINRWAPPSENNTQAYIDFVLKKSEIKPNERLEFKRKNQMCRLLWAMSYLENGKDVGFGHFENAYALV